MIQFYRAVSGEDYIAAQALFKAYATAIDINLDFQHFEEELHDLSKMYAPPVGGIILMRDEQETIGCVAIRAIDQTTGELKRMFIQPAYQGRGLGKLLLNEALQLARECSYDVIRLDTLNYMHPAIHLYKAAGFYEISAYYHNPIATALFFEKVM